MKLSRGLFQRLVARFVAGVMALVLATAPIAAQGWDHAAMQQAMVSSPCPHLTSTHQDESSPKRVGHHGAAMPCCHSAPPALALGLPVILTAPTIALALVAHSDPPIDGVMPAGPDEPPRYTV